MPFVIILVNMYIILYRCCLAPCVNTCVNIPRYLHWCCLASCITVKATLGKISRIMHIKRSKVKVKISQKWVKYSTTGHILDVISPTDSIIGTKEQPIKVQ